MEPIITGDGSPTLHNNQYNENYHCSRGAISEAFGKYAGACKVADIARLKGRVRILDVCFGLGYNSCAALDVILTAIPAAKMKIVGLEKDRAPLAAIGTLEPGFEHYGLIKDLAARPQEELRAGSVSMSLVLGDAVETISMINGLFDVVFHDPFSPRKNPELWTSDFFINIYALMKPGAVLATYSCAKHVRENLGATGLTVCDGPRIGRRGPSTLAFKKP